MNNFHGFFFSCTLSVIYVPIIPIARVHTLPRHMSQRHKTPEPPIGPGDGRPKTVRLWQRQASRQGRAERLLHLQSLLQVGPLIFTAFDRNLIGC